MPSISPGPGLPSECGTPAGTTTVSPDPATCSWPFRVRIHDAETADRERQLGVLRPHDLRPTFGYRLSETSGHNRAELERRLGHANNRYLRLYTNPPDDIAAGYVEDL